MSYCRSCGTLLEDGTRFCAKCGAQTGQSETGRPNARQTAPPPGAGAKRGLGAGAKLAISAVLIIFVGGIATAWYAAHKVSQKYHEIKAGINGPTASDRASRDVDRTPAVGDTISNSNAAGDPCRYLSKQDVGAAIGVEIAKTQAVDDACSYLAKGTPGDMAAKHAGSILGEKRGSGEQQKTAEQFAKAIFDSFPQDEHDADSDGSGNVSVLSVSVSNSSAATAEMQLNAKVMKHLVGQHGPATGEDLNIGDQAFVSSDGVIMIRKGQKSFGSCT